MVFSFVLLKRPDSHISYLSALVSFPDLDPDSSFLTTLTREVDVK